MSTTPATAARVATTPAMQPLAVDHVQVNVTDVDRSIRFYTEHLGLTQRGDRPDFSFGGAWLNAGGQQIHFVQAPAPPNLGQHFSLLVEDIEAAITGLRDRGIEVTDAVDSAYDRQAFLSDPDGNFIELHQRGGAAPR